MNMIPDPALQHEQIDEVTETGLNIAEMKVGGMTPSSTPDIYFAKKSMIKTSKLKVFDFDLNSLLGEFSRCGDLINMMMFSRQNRSLFLPAGSDLDPQPDCYWSLYDKLK